MRSADLVSVSDVHISVMTPMAGDPSEAIRRQALSEARYRPSNMSSTSLVLASDKPPQMQDPVEYRSFLTLAGLLPECYLSQQQRDDLHTYITHQYDSRPHIPLPHPTREHSHELFLAVLLNDRSPWSNWRRHHTMSRIKDLRLAYRDEQASHHDQRDTWNEYDEMTSLCCPIGRNAAIEHDQWAEKHGVGRLVDVKGVYGMGPDVYRESDSESEGEYRSEWEDEEGGDLESNSRSGSYASTDRPAIETQASI